MKVLISIAFCLVALSATGAVADVTIYQSAQLGTTGQISGDTVGPQFYLGVRFQVTSTVTANEIGGHFGINDPNAAGNGELFGALITLPDDQSVPKSANPLNTKDVMATTTFDVPYLSSNDVAAPISPVTLTPGWYAVMFGSGQFGATATAMAPVDNSEVGDPSFFSYSGEYQTYIAGGFTDTRFFVADVTTPTPEPGTMALVAFASLGMLARMPTGRRGQNSIGR